MFNKNGVKNIDVKNMVPTKMTSQVFCIRCSIQLQATMSTNSILTLSNTMLEFVLYLHRLIVSPMGSKRIEKSWLKQKIDIQDRLPSGKRCIKHK